MRTTTNGMPRYNSDGEFNNSFHITRNGMVPERCFRVIDDWSKLLNQYDVRFVSGSYDVIIPTENDFLYLDPPYANTKGMYYGSIDNEHLWKYLRDVQCGWALSFDGIAGEENNIFDVPNDLYDEHRLLKSGNSSFRRVIGKSTDTVVFESLYLKRRKETMAKLESWGVLLKQLQEANADANDCVFPSPNGNTIQCPHCHRDTGFPLITGEVLYADKRCPFCGEVVVHAHMITC